MPDDQHQNTDQPTERSKTSIGASSPPPSEPTTSTGRQIGSDLTAVSLDARMRYARALAAAGTLLPRGVTANLRPDDLQAIAARTLLITETGGMLGIHPIAALQGVQVIEGKPTISPALMESLTRRAGHKIRTTVTGTVRDGTIRATTRVTRADEPSDPYERSWDLERAERAGLCRIDRGPDGVRVVARSAQGKPLPWETYTEAMLEARSISEVCRRAVPDVLMGVGYTPEELGAIVDGDGVVIDVGEVREDKPQQPQPQPYPQPVSPAFDDPESGPGAVASAIAKDVLETTTTDALSAVWRSIPDRVRPYAWASRWRGVAEYAKSVEVGDPLQYGCPIVTLSSLFAAHAERIDHGDTDVQSVEDPTAGSGPESDAASSRAEDIVDAEIVDETPPAETSRPVSGGAQRVQVHDVQAAADADPWADGSGQSAVGHDEAVGRIATQLGGEIVHTDGADRETRANEAHAERVARAAVAAAGSDASDAAEPDAYTDTVGQAPEPGAGRRAWEAERDRLRAEQEARDRSAAERSTTEKPRDRKTR